MSALSDYRLLWKAAFVQRQKPGSILPGIVVAAGVLAFGGTVAAFVQKDWLFGLRAGLGATLLVLQFLWSILLVPGFTLMNTPANARLFPRMRRRMVEMTVAGWLVAPLAAWLCTVWQGAPAVALYMIGLSGVCSGRPSMLVVALAPTWVLKILPPQSLEFLSSVPGFVCSAVAVAIYGAWTIRVLLPAGGDRHFELRKQRVENSKQAVSTKRADAVPKRLANLYALMLRQAIRSGQPRRLMLHLFGPGASATLMLPTWILVILFSAVLHFVMQWLGHPAKGSSLPRLGLILSLTVILTMHLSTWMARWRLMKDATGEQCLFRLAARSPSAKRLNRDLGRMLIRQVVLNTAFGTAAAVAVAKTSGFDRDGLILVLSLSSTLFMPSVAFALLDYSREQRSWTLMPAVGILVAVALVVAFHMVLQHRIGVSSWVILTVYSNVIGAFIAAQRWKEMESAPVAFPTGRFA